MPSEAKGCSRNPRDGEEQLRQYVTEIARRTETENLHEIEMRHAIDQPAPRHRADTLVVIGVNLIDVAPRKFRFLAGVIEGPVAAQEMHGAKNKIEPVPVLLDPAAALCEMHRIVIQFDPGADFQIRIGRAQPIDLVEIDAGMITIVIREGDITQADATRVIGPGLQQLLRVGLVTVALRVEMVIGKKKHSDR